MTMAWHGAGWFGGNKSVGGKREHVCLPHLSLRAARLVVAGGWRQAFLSENVATNRVKELTINGYACKGGNGG